MLARKETNSTNARAQVEMLPVTVHDQERIDGAVFPAELSTTMCTNVLLS